MSAPEPKAKVGTCIGCKKPILEGEHYIQLAMGQTVHMNCIAEQTMRDDE